METYEDNRLTIDEARFYNKRKAKKARLYMEIRNRNRESIKIWAYNNSIKGTDLKPLPFIISNTLKLDF